MIFATVGTQLPFDRLIVALDRWAASNPDVEVFAQIGRGTYLPEHISWSRDLDPQDFRKQIAHCDTVVAHAGMGTIISAIELGKRVIVMPRRASLGEHRNEHQLATASRLEHLNGLEVVQQEQDLSNVMAQRPEHFESTSPSQPDPQLITAIRRFSGLDAA